jgi:Ser/Thr protein kinase RdoA (MazF antagonist)
MASPTAAGFTSAERSWLRAVDAALVAYLDDNFPDPTSLSQAVLHGDLSFEHVRLRPNGAVYFFDFGDMCWGPVAHELAQFLRGFHDVPISFERWADLRCWLLEGYRSRHVFTATDAAAIDVFLLNRAVALAKCILELNADKASASSAEAIKNTYRLAEAVLHKRHRAAGRTM